MSLPDRRMLTTPEDARDFARSLLDRAREEVEATVAEDYKEARRLAPDGVTSDDMLLSVVRHLREWRP